MAVVLHRSPEREVSVGFADWLGLVGALVALTVLPSQTDPLTGPKLLVLAVGAFAAIPATAIRWRKVGPPSGPLLIAPATAAALVIWAAISAIGSGAPWALSLFGWFGRGDGWLALASAVVLMLAAATLTRVEVARTITWLLWASGLVAFVGLLEAVGVQILQGTYAGVDATLGNPNFAAGYAAIMAVLAAGRALESARQLWVRISCGVLVFALALMSYLTGSLQGPAALAAGLAAGWIIWVLAYRGSRRMIALVGTGVGVVAGLALLGMSLVGIGPLTVLWADYTVQVRQQYWATGWSMTLGQPIFGSGPGSFARFVSEYRPESYVELLGPMRRVSAAHNIALQFGATLGVIGLLLWLVVMGSLVVLLLIRAARAQIVPVMLVAGVGGAWLVYVVQGMVSIDMLPLLALGWLVTGLLVAVLRPEAVPVAEPSGGKRGRARVARSSTRVGLVVGAGAALALIPFVLVSMQISAVSAATSVQSIEQAKSVLGNAMTPCPPRVEIAQAVLQSDIGAAGQDLVLDAYRIDPRCAPMVSFASEIALSRGDLGLADELTASGVAVDPLFSVSWLYRGQYELAAGDLPAARAALDEAERLDGLYPELGDAAPPDISAQLADLRSRIEAAGG